MKKKIQRNLKVLEQQNLVSSKNDYQDIVNAIAKVCGVLIKLFFYVAELLFQSFMG